VYYRDDLALVHHLGFGFHADMCAPGILALLEPVRRRGGVVLELGCGSGLLTRYLVEGGHQVIATDASPAMLELARKHASGADVRQIVLPDDPLPPVDAIVSVGHVLCYLADEAAVDRAMTAAARALRPGGVLAFDLCDLEWNRTRAGAPPGVWRGDDWLIVTEFSQPSESRFVRDMTTFLRNPDGTWRRDEEHHENVILDTSRVPGHLAASGIEASIRTGFGDEQLIAGLVAVVGRRPE
jgi:SAM-dependent methyltransferase